MDGRWLLDVSATSLILLLATGSAGSETPACRVQDCPNYRTIRYYEEIGCLPVRSDGSDECCPKRFDCSALLSLDKTKCYYDGKTYEDLTDISRPIKSLCTKRCICFYFSWRGEAVISCEEGGCAQEPIPATCYPTYTFDECCATGMNCANDTKSRRKFTECVYKGKTYLEGQVIEGGYSECMKCICQEGFDGTLREPWCQRRSCDYTLEQSISELQECAPVFEADDKCCAHAFHCPSTDDFLVVHSDPSKAYLDEQCVFGDHRLQIGDELLSIGEKCIRCRCDVPRFITCVELPDSQCPTAKK